MFMMGLGEIEGSWRERLYMSVGGRRHAGNGFTSIPPLIRMCRRIGRELFRRGPQTPTIEVDSRRGGDMRLPALPMPMPTTNRQRLGEAAMGSSGRRRVTDVPEIWRGEVEFIGFVHRWRRRVFVPATHVVVILLRDGWVGASSSPPAATWAETFRVGVGVTVEGVGGVGRGGGVDAEDFGCAGGTTALWSHGPGTVGHDVAVGAGVVVRFGLGTETHDEDFAARSTRGANVGEREGG